MSSGSQRFKGVGAITAGEKDVTVTEPKSYPAVVGIHLLKGDDVAYVMDFVPVESAKDFRFLVSRAKTWADEASAEKALELAKLFYGELDKDDAEVLKAGWQLGVKRYGKRKAVRGVVGYEEWPAYSGLGKDKSGRINVWLWDAAFAQKTLDLEKLVSGLVERFDLDRRQAENIVRTELANIFNKMREWAYTRETGIKKFRWIAKFDACEKCKEVEALAAKGVSLAELKAIIKQVGGEYAREWTVHPQCRCTFTRFRGAMRDWEKPR
ncbi:MAG: hypothetical protein QXN23_05865 [Candidatus Caldarchaeum sp.]